MNLGELFQRLSYSELSGMHVGQEGVGLIHDDHKDRLTQYTNQALTLLHSKFPHKVDYVKLIQVDGLQRYVLKNIHAVSNTDVGNTAERYIQDSVDMPFEDILIRVLSIEEEDTDEDTDEDPQRLTLNQDFNEQSIRTLSYNTLWIPKPVAGRELTIQYQLGHPKLSFPANMDEEIDVAPLLEDALQTKVASKVFGAISGEDALTRHQMLENEFTALCSLVKEEDLLSLTQTSAHSKLTDRGFV